MAPRSGTDPVEAAAPGRHDPDRLLDGYRAARTQEALFELRGGPRAGYDEFIDAAGKDVAEGTFLTCACGDANSDPKAKNFVAAYAALNNGAKPGTYSGEAYDATNALVQVLKGLGSNVDRATVLDAFKKVNFTGLTKQVVFQPNGEVQGDAVYVYQVVNGQRKVLGLTKELVK